MKDARHPRVKGEVARLLDEFDASYGFIGNDGTVFYVLTDLDAPRKPVIAIDTRHPERSRWRELTPQGDDVIESVQIIHDTFVANYLHDAHSGLRLFALDGRFLEDLTLPTLGSVGTVSGERKDDAMFYAFTSFLYPTTIFRYDFKTRQTSVFKAPTIDFDPSGYETEQVFYRSRDGTRVPMFLTHKKGLKQDGTNPTYLYGYGGFNISLTPSFSVATLAWLERGGVYAVPTLRGGGEYGEEWHEAGMHEKKQNVFDDFIAAAEYLIKEGYTAPVRLAIGGGSNGGLLVGAAITQRPELFGAALPEQLGTLRDRRADEQPAVRPTADREPHGRGVALLDQVLRRRDEVVEHVLLLLVHARLVPLLAVLAAAPQGGHRVYAPPLEPRERGHREARGEADVEPTVAV